MIVWVVENIRGHGTWILSIIQSCPVTAKRPCTIMLIMLCNFLSMFYGKHIQHVKGSMYYIYGQIRFVYLHLYNCHCQNWLLLPISLSMIISSVSHFQTKLLNCNYDLFNVTIASVCLMRYLIASNCPVTSMLLMIFLKPT